MEIDSEVIANSPDELQKRFTDFGGIKLVTDDLEKFYVLFKLHSERCGNEESVFNELCSAALNNDRNVTTKMLERIQEEYKAPPEQKTPNTYKISRPTIDISLNESVQRELFSKLENTPPSRTPKYVPIKKTGVQPGTPIQIHQQSFKGQFSRSITGKSTSGCELQIFNPKDGDEMFLYGRRFTDTQTANFSLEDQLSAQLTADDNPNDRVELSGRLQWSSVDESAPLRLVNGKMSVFLDVSALTNFSYFPGMEGTFKCIPASLNTFKAVEYKCPQLPPISTIGGSSDFLKVVIACGNLAANGDGQPLIQKLTERAISLGANALILNGPFYGAGDTDICGISRSNFSILNNIALNTTMRIIVVANAFGSSTSPPVFPTPQPTAADFGLCDIASNITFLTDPCLFDLNGIRFAITNSEPLRALSKAERYQGEVSEDRMSRLCRHILSQKSLCPVASSTINNAILFEGCPQHLFERPHFCILPTVLQPMIKNVEKTVFINSGKVISGSGVRYAVIEVDVNKARAADVNSLSIADYSSIKIETETL